MTLHHDKQRNKEHAKNVDLLKQMEHHEAANKRGRYSPNFQTLNKPFSTGVWLGLGFITANAIAAMVVTVAWVALVATGFVGLGLFSGK